MGNNGRLLINFRKDGSVFTRSARFKTVSSIYNLLRYFKIYKKKLKKKFSRIVQIVFF